METQSDSDQSRRERRKTAAEIFFGEELVFSDSEEEAEFSRLTFGPFEKVTSVPEHSDREESNPLLESILKVCCRKCICCRRILLLFHSTEKYPDPNQSLSPSFETQNFSTPAKSHVQQSIEKLNSSKKVSIVSSHVIPSSEALLPSDTNSSNQIDNKCILSNVASSNSLDDKAKTKRGKRETVHSKRSQKRKFDQCVGSKESDNDQPGTTNKLSKSNNWLSNPDEQTDNAAGNNSLATAKVENSSLELKNKRVRRTLEYGRESTGNYGQENVQNDGNTSDTRKSRPAKRRCKEKLKSMSDKIILQDNAAGKNILTTAKAENSSMELKNKGVGRTLEYRTENIGNYGQENVENNVNASDTRTSRRAKKLCSEKMKYMSDKINLEETVLDGSVAKEKSAQLKKRKSVYSMIDKRVFRMTIDTTADRGFVKAITRKLARRGGASLGLDTFSKHNESFRLQSTQKLKKLYSPTEWLDSPLFERICKYDE